LVQPGFVQGGPCSASRIDGGWRKLLRCTG
jgi:hypothetical protein